MSKMKRTKKLLASALIISGLGASVYAITDGQPAAAQINVSSHTINELKAKDIALYASKGGLVTDSHIENEDGIKKYEMTVVKPDREFDIEIDALTGTVTKLDQKVRDQNETNVEIDNPQNASPKISLEEAKKIALNQVKGTITEAELEDEDHRLVYEFEIQTANYHEIEIKVDAATGKVSKVKLDD